MKTYLNVPFEQKDQAKQLGARFDMSSKRWFVPDGTDIFPFMKWVPYIEKDVTQEILDCLKGKR